VVTGGARGIGFEVARRLAREGATVVLLDMVPEVLNESVKVCRCLITHPDFVYSWNDGDTLCCKPDPSSRKAESIVLRCGYHEAGPGEDRLPGDPEGWLVSLRNTKRQFLFIESSAGVTDRNTARSMCLCSPRASLDRPTSRRTKWMKMVRNI
jgi:hypothetical protein